MARHQSEQGKRGLTLILQSVEPECYILFSHAPERHANVLLVVCKEKNFSPLALLIMAFIIGISVRALILICNSNKMIAPHNILARHTKAVLICGTVNKLLTCCDLDSEHQELFIFLTKCWWMAHILPLYDIVSLMLILLWFLCILLVQVTRAVERNCLEF